jgi:Cu+-exporting ATPase
MQTLRVTMPIEGLGCWGSGALIVERAVAKAPGVLRAYVNPATEMAYIEYDTAATDPQRLAAAVARAGFQAGLPRTH